MKKLLLYLPFLMVLACSQLENQIDRPNQLNKELIEKVISQPDAQIQKGLYLQLNASEKMYIWSNRIDDFVVNNTLTEQQKNHLGLLKAKFNIELFGGDKSTLKRIEREWGAIALDIFDKEEIKIVLGTLRPLKNQIVTKSNARISVADCGCNGDSWFDCSACNSTDACKKDSNGCGFLWGFSCNQSCHIAPESQL